MSTLAGTEPARSPTRGDGRREPVLVVYGTRPEAVKLAPLIRALDRSPHFGPVVAITGQHREMVDAVNDAFAVTPEFDLDIHRTGQSLADITAAVLAGVDRIVRAVNPRAVLVQGDTATTFAAALAAAQHRVPVVHLEAGLRTDDMHNPFPEEINRRLTTALASLHLAPTASAKANLVRENVDPEHIVVTGNTVVDAAMWATEHPWTSGAPCLDDLLDTDTPIVVVTAHRRESWGEPLRQIARAVAAIAARHPEVAIVFPVHPNPIVREAVVPILGDIASVRIVEPLAYGTFLRLLARAHVVVTDSGGIQEEAPSLGTPVVVTRSTTERIEGIATGAGTLVGTSSTAIVAAVESQLSAAASGTSCHCTPNPYGDGQAAQRGVMALAHHFGLGPRPLDFGTAVVGDERGRCIA